MKLAGLSIDGFGIFHDVHVPDLPHGLVVFLGDNEAGKSTTLAFVQTVLFGYPDRRTSDKTYPARAGGQAGGRLVLDTDTLGRITVERRDGRKGGAVTLTHADGTQEGKTALVRLLGGTTRRLYRNLYAFSLDELQELSTLTDDEVRDVIHGASLGTGAHRLADARKRLASRLDELFKPGGSKPEMNKLVKQLETVSKDIAKAGKGIQDYQEMTTTIERLATNIGAIDTALRDDRARHKRVENHERLWEDWTLLQDAEAHLADLPEESETIPAGGRERLDTLTTDLKTEKETQRAVAEELEQKRDKMARKEFDAKLLEHEAEIRSLVRGVKTYDAALRELPRAGDRQRDEQRQAEGVLAELGAEWTEERARDLDRSTHVREALATHDTKRQHAARHADRTGDAVVAAQEQFAAARAGARSAAARVEELAGDRLDIDRATLAELRTGRKSFGDVLRDLPRRQGDRQAAAAALGQALREIHPDWTEETLAALDGSITAQQRIEDFEKRLGQAEQRAHDAEGTLQRAQATVSDVEEESARRKRARRSSLGKSIDPASLMARAAAGAGALAFVAGTVLWWAGRPTEGLTAAAALLVMAGVLLALARANRRTAPAGEQVAVDDLAAQKQRATIALDDARRADEAARVGLETVRKDWRDHVTAIGLAADTQPRSARLVFTKADTARVQAGKVADLDLRLDEMATTRSEYLKLMRGVPALESTTGMDDSALLSALSTFLTDMDSREKSARELEQARHTLEEAETRAADATKKLVAVEEDGAAAQAAVEATSTALSGWLTEHGLDTHWSPQVAAHALDLAGQLADVVARRDEATAEARRLTAEVEEFRARVAAVTAALGREAVPTDKLADGVHHLDSDLDNHRQRRTLHQSLADEIPALEKRSDHRRRRIDKLQGTIDEMVTAAGVTDIDEFRRRAQEHADRETLIATIVECEKNMKKFAGSADMVALRQQLAGESVEGLHAEAAELAERIERTDQELKERLNEHGQAEARRHELSAADSIAPLRAEQERLRAALHDCAADWGRHAVAQHLLMTAKERFEQAHQPEVFKAAGRFFSEITGGRYTQVFAPHDGDAIEVIDGEGRRKAVDDLSRGTAEQLYLAIRFGYIASDTSPGEKLPILMDDVLVNFDPGRAALAAQSILTVARDRQVLFFTCHPETVDLLRSLDHGVAVYHLTGNTIAKDTTSRAVT